MADKYKATVEELLKAAGVKIGGKDPWDLQVHYERVFGRILAEGSLGVGESYMDGWWDTRDLEGLLTRALRVDLDLAIGSKLSLARTAALARLTNLQSVTHSYRNVRHHYDIGNELYEKMLGPTMVYSCGYWAEADALDAAQTAKLDLICRKLALKKGMRLLDIGCGWGSLVRFAAEKYGVECVGITLSQEQADFAKKQTKGLNIEIQIKDYRELEAKPFDRIVSVGMFEHVGPRNYRQFFEVCDRLLSKDGIMLLHTIGGNRPARGGDPWINRYIFPGGVIPSAEGVMKASRGIFLMEDWHNFGPDYAKTLRAWWKNFDEAYPKLDHQKYDHRFYRMWKFYLLACAANFTMRNLQLWQIVFTKQRGEIDYLPVR